MPMKNHLNLILTIKELWDPRNRLSSFMLAKLSSQLLLQWIKNREHQRVTTAVYWALQIYQRSGWTKRQDYPPRSLHKNEHTYPNC